MAFQDLYEEIMNEKKGRKKKKKPSAGTTKKERSSIAKKAKAGKDIGKKGKNFKKVEAAALKKYGDPEVAQKVAAAVMWKIMGQ